jgi:hypothetical protein
MAMRHRDRQRHPQLEPLEPLTLLSTPLSGTAHGTFFAHKSNPGSGTIDDVYASGKIAGVGPTLLVGGFQTAGFTARGTGGGNLIFGPLSRPGNLFLRLTETAAPTAATPGRYSFRYTIVHGSGAFDNAAGSGTLTVTLKPMNTDVHGQPTSHPGFFGNSTLTFG